LEKQYLAWAADVRSDDNPYAAGLGFAVKPDKPGLLAGPALRKIRDEGPAERLCWFTAEADVIMHGGELVTHLDHDCAASVRSAGYGFTVGRTVFSAYLPVAIAAATASEPAGHAPEPGRGSESPAQRFVVEVADERFGAVRHSAPLYDPTGTRIRA
jgi:4-methylaminobutanoate oxidase (formaldehyde-forming)